MVPNLTNTETTGEGSTFVGGEFVPGFLAMMPIPVTYCRMYWRDGKPYDYRYLYVNPAFEAQLIGGPVIGRLASEVVPGFRDSPRPILGIYGRVAAGGGPEGFELYLDPYRKWVTVKAFSPRPDHFVAVYTMIDEKVSGTRLRGIYDAMAEGFVVRDRNGRIVDFNPATERILGLSAERLRDLIPGDQNWKTLREDLTPLPREEVSALITLRTGEALRNRVMGLRFPDGRLKWISVNTEPIGGKGGAPEYVVSTLIDITERKRAERQRLAVLETMSDGFLAIDGQWRFVHANAAAERMLGTRREELLGRNQWEVYPATLGSPVEKAYREAAAGRPSAFENFYEPWQRWFSCRCFPRELGGITVFFSDVTEARGAQEALRRSHDDLRSLVGQMNSVEERERARIARELHDELQQSLAAAKLEIMAVRRALGEGARELRELAGSAARNLDLVIKSTRRIVGDLRPPVLDTLGLGAALETLAERVRALTGIDADVRTLDPHCAATGLPEEVAYCLYRIAQESLNNVQKHADAVRVEVCLDLGTPGSVALQVRDDGRGLQEGDLRKGGSFGVLGMRERVHALGGELSVAGDPGGGTTVRASVPLRMG